MNMGVIPATGKALNIPSGTNRISFSRDKIPKNQSLVKGPNAGMAEFLAAFRAGLNTIQSTPPKGGIIERAALWAALHWFTAIRHRCCRWHLEILRGVYFNR